MGRPIAQQVAQSQRTALLLWLAKNFFMLS
jgi:hypothetical protein